MQEALFKILKGFDLKISDHLRQEVRQLKSMAHMKARFSALGLTPKVSSFEGYYCYFVATCMETDPSKQLLLSQKLEKTFDKMHRKAS